MVRKFMCPTRLRLQQHIIAHFFAPRHGSKGISTTAAINKGLRATQDAKRPQRSGHGQERWANRGNRGRIQNARGDMKPGRFGHKSADEDPGQKNRAGGKFELMQTRRKAGNISPRLGRTKGADNVARDNRWSLVEDRQRSKFGDGKSNNDAAAKPNLRGQQQEKDLMQEFQAARGRPLKLLYHTAIDDEVFIEGNKMMKGTKVRLRSNGNHVKRHLESRFSENSRDHQNRYPPFREANPYEDEKTRNQVDRFPDSHPISIPYSTAASQFLYGVHPVLAALKSNRRQLYALHLRTANSSLDELPAPKSIYNQIQASARSHDLKVNLRPSLQLLDTISSSRNHQNVALEASRLPFPAIASLGYPIFTPADKKLNIPITYTSRRSEEDKKIDGSDPSLVLGFANQKSWHKPLVVFLDGILDPQNLGNILRTCYFYNVTAVAIAVNTCAPISSPVVAKASSGACEAIPLFCVSRPSDFIYQCAHAGWRVFGSVAPVGDRTGASASETAKYMSTVDIKKNSPLAKRPSILMFGSEGEGLRQNLLKNADKYISIHPPQRVASGGVGNKGPSFGIGVDSLNVGTSVGALLEAFYTEPPSTTLLHPNAT